MKRIALTTLCLVALLTSACDSGSDAEPAAAPPAPTSEASGDDHAGDDHAAEAHDDQAAEAHDDHAAHAPGAPDEPAAAEGGDHAHDDMAHVVEEGSYDPAEVVLQPGAAVGDLAQCPVSGEVFRITEDHTYFEHAGEPVFFCCPGCIRRFQREPERWLETQDVAEGA